MNINDPSVNFHPENACASEIFLEGNPHRNQPEIPTGFQPSVCPIISRHVLGIEPTSFGAACATIVADPQYRRLIVHLHEQGTRPVGELLAEIAVAHGLQADISERLARFAAIPDNALDVTNGRCFSPDPIYEVSR